MSRLVTWLLVMAVVVLAVQDRKQARVLRELQGQRRWVVRAREEHERWREMMEVHDGERGVIRERMEQLADVLGVEWETDLTADNTENAEGFCE